MNISIKQANKAQNEKRAGYPMNLLRVRITTEQ